MQQPAAVTASRTLSVEVATTLVMLEALQPDYERLQRVAGSTSPFALFDWHHCWCSHFLNLDASVTDELMICALRNDQRDCVAIIPLIASRRRFGPLSVVSIELLGADPSTTESRTPLIEAGYEEAAVVTVRGFMARNPQWDWINWGSVEESFGRALAVAPGVTDSPSAPGYVLDLPSSWAELKASLKRNIREALRHSYNSLKRDGHAFCFQIGTAPDEVRQGVERFFELHTLRAGMTGTITHRNHFTTDVSKHFLLAVCARLAEAGRVLVFQLRIGANVVAVRIGFLVGDSLHLYYSGFDPAWARYGVMTTALAESLKHAIERQLKTVNLSRGTDTSKTRWRPRMVGYCDALELRPRLKSRIIYRCYQSVRSGKGFPSWLLRRFGKAPRAWN